MPSLDKKDKALLNLLQANSKRTTKAYALQLGLSTTAVYERMRRALVNKQTVERNFVVYCHIKLIQHTKDYVMQFEKDIAQLNEVVECYHISGDYDYIIKVHVAHMQDYREFMVSKLTAIPHIGSTQSAFVMNEVKHTTALIL